MVMAGLPPQSGAFSKLLHPQSASSQPFKLLTWNARALAHSKKSLRRRKAVLIEQWCQQQAVIALQEVHGNLASLNLQLHRCLKTHTLFFNPHAAEDTGGTLFWSPKHGLRRPCLLFPGPLSLGAHRGSPSTSRTRR